MYKNVSFVNTSHKISQNFQGIHHYTVSIQNGVYSTIRYWYHEQLETGSRIAIWAIKQNGRKVWLKVLYLFIYYSDKNLPHLYKSCLLYV